MKRRIVVLLFATCLCLSLSACGKNKEQSGKANKSQVNTENQKETQEVEEVSGDPIVNQAMKDYEVVKASGFTEDGQSNLGFTIEEGSMQDCGDYYSVKATFAKEVKVTSDLKIGEEVTFIINDMTGETDTAVYKEKGILYSEKTEMEYWYYPQDGENDTVLYCFSDDRVESPFYEGILLIRKDAQCGEDITKTYRTVEMDNLFTYYNGVRFDEDGYVTALIFFGD